MNQLTSYGFIFVLIFLAIFEGNAGDHISLIKGLTFSIILAYAAFFLTWITIDAVLPVIILGTAILGFGGWILTVAVVVFFITGSLFTRLNHDRVPTEKLKIYETRRDGQQVWANGFWIAIFCIVWFLTDVELFLAAAFAVVAVATADTWATEVGLRNPGRTVSVISGKVVQPGTDGGVSLKGTFFSLLGALLIGFFASQGVGQNPAWIMGAITLAGFLGCIIDSYVGAIYQSGENSKSETVRWSKLDSGKKNSIVNWVSTGSGGFIALVLLLII